MSDPTRAPRGGGGGLGTLASPPPSPQLVQGPGAPGVLLPRLPGAGRGAPEHHRQRHQRGHLHLRGAPAAARAQHLLLASPRAELSAGAEALIKHFLSQVSLPVLGRAGGSLAPSGRGACAQPLRRPAAQGQARASSAGRGSPVLGAGPPRLQGLPEGAGTGLAGCGGGGGAAAASTPPPEQRRPARPGAEAPRARQA